jgi:TonB family protein
MEKYLLVLLILISQNPLKAQTTTKSDTIVTSPQVDAEYPGGILNFFQFLGQNIIYPPNAVRLRITGRVFVSFNIEANGKLTDLALFKGVYPELDKEALRVMALSPEWLPAKQKGHHVKAHYTFPVVFYLVALQDIQDGLDTIYKKVDEPPRYSKGEDQLYEFFSSKIKNPFEIFPDHIKGQVSTVFVVEKDGSLSHITPLNIPTKAMADEAIRLIKSLPEKFIPATQNGVPVRAETMVLIHF